MSTDSQNLSDNERRRLIRHTQTKADPRMYARYYWQHPNRKESYDFRTNSGEPIEYLTDDRGPLNPDEWADLNIFLMARGCLKTTSTLMIMNWALDMYPQAEGYMTAPTEDPPITEYVDKFENAAENTPLYDDGRVEKEAQKHHKYSKDVPDGSGGTFTAYSALKTQTAYNPDRLRGPHSHLGVIDEVQDCSPESFSMFLQMVDQGMPDEPNAPFPCVFIIGTPKEKNTLFHTLWEQSNKRTWDQDDGEWIDQSDVGRFTPPSVDDDDGDMDAYTIKAWHVDQYNSPLEAHKPSKIAFTKSQNTPKETANEVEAKFFSPENDLLGQEHVHAAFDDSRGFRNSRRSEDSEVVITADWGGGGGKDAADTVFTAAELIEDEEQFVHTDAYESAIENDVRVPYQVFVLNHQFLDHSLTKPEEEEIFREWVEKFQPTNCVIDQGHNGSRRSRLRDTYGDLIVGCKYGNVNPPNEPRWSENELDEPVICNVDKAHVCEKFVDHMKDGRYVIPAADLGAPEDRGSDAHSLISQLTAPYEKQSDTKTGSKRLYIESDRNDDSFDTFTYQFVANDFMKELTPNIGPESITMNNRVGY